MKNDFIYFSNGRSAISRFLKACDVIIVPENFCDEILNEIFLGKKIIFAKLPGIFSEPDYEPALSLALGQKIGLLFVHQYGIVNSINRDNVWNICKTRGIYFLDDFCLCKPSDFFRYLVRTKSEKYAAIISFGYAKYIDFNGGCIATSSKTFYVNNDRPNSLSQKKNLNLDEFIQSLKSAEIARTAHSKHIRRIYQEHFFQMEFLDAPWRFCIKLQHSDTLWEFFTSPYPSGLFWGFNYPPVKKSENTGKFRGSWKSKGPLVVNLFHDYRFNISMAKRLIQLTPCR